MAATHRDLQIFLICDKTRDIISIPSLGDRELSALLGHELHVASWYAARDTRQTLLLGQIYNDYKALDQDMRNLLNKADEILESAFQLVSAEDHSKAKLAVVEFKKMASLFDSAMKKLLSTVHMGDLQAIRQLSRCSYRIFAP